MRILGTAALILMATVLPALGQEGHEVHGAAVHHDDGGHHAHRNEIALFLGVGYSFHIGERYAVIPQINLDLVNSEKVWVGGIAFGIMF